MVAFASVLFTLKLPAAEKSDWITRLKQIDFLGAITLVIAVFCFLLGADRGSNDTWVSLMAIVPMCLAVVFFIAFVYVEVRVASYPFAPGHIIFERSLFACYLCNFFSFGSWVAATFYISLYFQASDGISASEVGVRLLPYILSSVSGSLFGGIVMKATGKYYWLTAIGYSLLTLGLTMTFGFSGFIGRNTVWFIVGTVFGGFGNGIGVTSTLTGLSKFSLSTVTLSKLIFPSCECGTRRHGSRDCMYISVSNSRGSYGPVVIRNDYTTIPPRRSTPQPSWQCGD